MRRPLYEDTCSSMRHGRSWGFERIFRHMLSERQGGNLLQFLWRCAHIEWGHERTTGILVERYEDGSYYIRTNFGGPIT
jgi:hypothetical protein